MLQIRFICFRAVSIWMIVTLFLSAMGGGANQPVFAAPVKQEEQPTPRETPTNTSMDEATAIPSATNTETLPVETLVSEATQTPTSEPLVTPSAEPTYTQLEPTMEAHGEPLLEADSGLALQSPVGLLGNGVIINKIAAGDGYTCVLTTGGAVKCWGKQSATPVDISGLGSGVNSYYQWLDASLCSNRRWNC